MFGLSWGGVHFCVHFRGSTSMFTSGGPLPWSLPGGPLHVHFWGVSHVTYPIMLLYTAIECPSASWAKFTWDPPPPELNRLTNKQLWKHYLPTLRGGGNKCLIVSMYYSIIVINLSVINDSVNWVLFCEMEKKLQCQSPCIIMQSWFFEITTQCSITSKWSQYDLLLLFKYMDKLMTR